MSDFHIKSPPRPGVGNQSLNKRLKSCGLLLVALAASFMSAACSSRSPVFADSLEYCRQPVDSLTEPAIADCPVDSQKEKDSRWGDSLFDGIKYDSTGVCRKKIAGKYIACGKDLFYGAQQEEAIEKATGNTPITAIHFAHIGNNVEYGEYYITVRDRLQDTVCSFSPATVLWLTIDLYTGLSGSNSLEPYALVEDVEVLWLPSECDRRLWTTEGYSIYRFDNGDDYVSDGLLRVIDKDNFIGYATPGGEVVIVPQFAFGFPFVDGKAKVTDSGSMKTVGGSNGEYSEWESDDWYYIDRDGRRLPAP